MGVRGLLSFVASAPGCCKTLKFEEILEEIHSVHKPKIVIYSSAFFSYFYSVYSNIVTGCRFNLIHQEFEEFLAKLEEAGAEIIFTCKKGNTEIDYKWIHYDNHCYENGMKFLKTMQSQGEFSRTTNYKLLNASVYSHSMSSALYYSAFNHGELKGICQSLKRESTVEIAKIAREIGAYAVIGLDTGFFYVEGDFKLWSLEAQMYPEHYNVIKFDIREFDKKAILDFFSMDLVQFQFFAVLSGKFAGDLEAREQILNFFPAEHKIKPIRDFIHKHVPSPITDEVIKNVVEIIFGREDPQIFEDFKSSFDNLNLDFREPNDEEVAKLFKDDPFAFDDFLLITRTIYVSSYHHDVTATDMKPLKNLTLDWMRRTMGLMLEHVGGDKMRKVMYRVDEVEWGTIEVQPIEPDFFVPDLKQLILGTVNDEIKYEMLAFLTGNLIGIENLKEIPIEFLTHVIITVHLVTKKSLEVFEAIALTKVLKDVVYGKIPRVVILPKQIDVRALRTSFLYSTIFYYFTRCLSSVGLKSFISPIMMDNAYYQSIYHNMKIQKFTEEKVFEQIMTIVKE